MQIANGSTCGVLEDVIVTIDTFQFLIDFIVSHSKVKGDVNQIPINLGRPFLATARAINYREKGEIKIKVGDDGIPLNLTKLIKWPVLA